MSDAPFVPPALDAESATAPPGVSSPTEAAMAAATDAPEPTAEAVPPPAAPPVAEAAAPTPPASARSTSPSGPSRAGVLLDKGARVTGRGAKVIVRELSERRGLRTVLLGAFFTLLGVYLGSGSALSVPLLVIGVVMLIVGAMGPRLRGHIGLDFGPEGTAITMHTHIAPPGRKLAAQSDGEGAVIQLPPRPRIALVPSNPLPAPAPAPADEAQVQSDVIESSGETVEIDVAQLRALLDAQDRADAQRSAG